MWHRWFCARIIPGMKSIVRYQAAIIRNDHILLLKVWDHAFSGRCFWVIPGGGRNHGESEEDCVIREVREETHLQVEVDQLILDKPEVPEGMCQRARAYSCRFVGGTVRPGVEP